MSLEISLVVVVGLSKLYTKEIADAVHRVDKPIPLTVQIIEFDDYIAVRPDTNFQNNYTFRQRVMVNKYLFRLQEVIESYGPKCRVFGMDGISG